MGIFGQSLLVPPAAALCSSRHESGGHSGAAAAKFMDSGRHGLSLESAPIATLRWLPLQIDEDGHRDELP